MAEDRKTFTIPPGYEAVRDSEGRATGEVRRLSADSIAPPLPCPFCGEMPKVIAGATGVRIQCLGEECFGPSTTAEWLDDAIFQWNRRVPAPAQAASNPLTASVPDDLRFGGWAVAVHNDYRVGGLPHTFWLFTKGDRAVKGEGETDAEALNLVREQLFGAAQPPAAPVEKPDWCQGADPICHHPACSCVVEIGPFPGEDNAGNIGVSRISAGTDLVTLLFAASDEDPDPEFKELLREAANTIGAQAMRLEACDAEIARLRAVPQTPSGPAETWAYIEHLLTEECGLREDEGLQGQRANCINAIKNGLPDAALMDAAIEFLSSGEGLHKIRVGGKMMTRKDVASALSRPQHSIGEA